MTQQELKAHVDHAGDKRCRFTMLTLDGKCVNCGFNPRRSP